MNSLRLLRRRVDINMNKLYILRHFTTEPNVVKCYYDVVDRKYVYKAINMFSIVEVNGIFQPVFKFCMDTLEKVDITDMKCELCNDIYDRICIDIEYNEDGSLMFIMPYNVYRNLSVGKVYNGKLYNGHIEIQFQYELVMDCNGN